MKNTCVIFFFVLLLILKGFSEEYQRFNEYNMQPEVWHFEGPVQSNVDAKGDLHLNIPVLNIPGTNGLSFDVNFSYKAGITYHQRASWIGLGWNFDPGSITRDVYGNVEVNNTYYGVDYGDDSNTFTYAPDAFYLTIPGKDNTAVFYCQIDYRRFVFLTSIS